MAAREYHCPGWRSWLIRCRPDPAAWWCSLLLLFSEGLLAHQPPGLSQTECIHPALFTYQGSLIWHISQQNLLREGALLDDIGWSSGPFPCILGALDQATRPRPAFELRQVSVYLDLSVFVFPSIQRINALRGILVRVPCTFTGKPRAAGFCLACRRM